MNIYSIYKIVNLINSKVYIGFASNFNARITQHKRNYKKYNSKLYYACRKYGIESFSFEIIYQSLDSDHCKNVMENYFIESYNSYYEGYNMTFGGDGTLGRYWTEEQKRKASIKNKGAISPNKGKTYEELYGSEKAAEKIKKFSETYKKTAALKPKKEKPKRQPYGKERVGFTYEELFGEEKAKIIKEKHRVNTTGEKNPRYGKPGTFKGKTHSPETLKKLKQPRGPQSTIECPYCKKTGGIGNMNRYHLDNCKFKS